MKELLLKLLGGTGGNIIESITAAAKTFITTDADREKFAQQVTAEINRHMEQLEENAAKIYSIEVDDRKSARERDTAANTAPAASWLSRNIVPLLALLVLGSTLFLWGKIMFDEGTANGVTMGVISSLSTLATFVMSYYFGSSITSASKDKSISNLISQKN